MSRELPSSRACLTRPGPRSQDAKKAQKKEVKQALKALSLSHEPPAYVAENDCDELLRNFGLPLSKLGPLKITFGDRVVAKADVFSKTKAGVPSPASPLLGPSQLARRSISQRARREQRGRSVRRHALLWSLVEKTGRSAAGTSLLQHQGCPPGGCLTRTPRA